MAGPYTPSRGGHYNNQRTPESQNAALLGAAIAFGRQPPKPRQISNSHAGVNGSSKAAGVSGRPSKTPSPKHGTNETFAAPVGSPSPAASVQSVKSSGGKARPTMEIGSVPRLAPPALEPTRSKSPSQRAALVAATIQSPTLDSEPAATRPRAKTVHKPSVAPKPRRLSVHQRRLSDDVSDRPTDSSRIPPTTSLVDLFERKASNQGAPRRRPEPIVAKASPDLPLRSPKPVRTSDVAVFQMELEGGKSTPRPATKMATEDDAPSAQLDGNSSSDSYVSASEDNAPPSSPLTVVKRGSRAPSIGSMISVSPPDLVRQRLRPSPSPLRHSSTDPIQIHIPSRRVTSPPEPLSASAQSNKSITAQWHQMYPRRVTPLNTGDALANAIVASSLASSRAPSPHKIEPPPVPAARRPKQQHKPSFSKTPSPPKVGMRHTLRKPESEDSESEDEMHPYGKHKKKRHLRKHPNKHHEGDRKRWRDAVTEPERKRYAGVWAANKGRCYSFTAEEERALRLNPDSAWAKSVQVAVADQVSNIIVKDLWSRSRLAAAVLETVWDLVDNDGVGRLNKDEFIVGMWLIDQRLKGRKLPVKVTDSVWASVRRLQGIKIKG